MVEAHNKSRASWHDKIHELTASLASSRAECERLRGELASQKDGVSELDRCLKRIRGVMEEHAPPRESQECIEAWIARSLIGLSAQLAEARKRLEAAEKRVGEMESQRDYLDREATGCVELAMSQRAEWMKMAKKRGELLGAIMHVCEASPTAPVAIEVIALLKAGQPAPAEPTVETRVPPAGSGDWATEAAKSALWGIKCMWDLELDEDDITEGESYIAREIRRHAPQPETAREREDGKVKTDVTRLATADWNSKPATLLAQKLKEVLGLAPVSECPVCRGYGTVTKGTPDDMWFEKCQSCNGL